MMMRGIALPTGAFDWDRERAPERVFRERLAAVRRLMAERGLSRMVMAANTFDDGAAAWLTSFTPKLGPAFALIPAQGEPRLLFSGGPGMKSSAQKLTWLNDVLALKSLPPDAIDFFKGTTSRLGLYAGAALAHSDWAALRGVATEIVLLDEGVNTMRGERTAADLRTAELGASLFGRVEIALERAVAKRLDRRCALLAAERQAREAGAQDFRARISLRPFGPPEPADHAEPLPNEGVSVAIALRVQQIWFTGTTGVSSPPQHVRRTLANAWRSLMEIIGPGATLADLRKTVSSSCSLKVEAIGFSMSESALAQNAPIGPGKVLSVSLASLAETPAAGCAFVEIGDHGARVLWAAPVLHRKETVE